MTVGAAGVSLIKKHEKCVLVGYLPTPKDKPTNGYGHTGADVVLGAAITQEQADADLVHDLAWADECVTSTCAESSPEQHDAMVSLAFNIGAPRFKTSSVARLHNAGRYSEACQAFGLWNQQAGKVLIELVHRRAEEAVLYASGTTIADDVKLPVTAGAEGEKPLFVTKTMISTATAGLGTAATVASQVNQQIQIVKSTSSDIHDAVATGIDIGAVIIHYGKWAALVLIVAGLCGIAYARWSEKRTGRN